MQPWDETENQAATFLHLCTDPGSEDWGWAPMSWQNCVGSVIVVRADRKDLAPQHVEVLSHFCQFKMGDLFEDSHGCDPPISKYAVLEEMTKAKFTAYFENYRHRMLNDGIPGWIDVKSPYAE